MLWNLDVADLVYWQVMATLKMNVIIDQLFNNISRTRCILKVFQNIPRVKTLQVDFFLDASSCRKTSILSSPVHICPNNSSKLELRHNCTTKSYLNGLFVIKFRWKIFLTC